MERVFKRVRAHGVIPAPLGGGDYRVRNPVSPLLNHKIKQNVFFFIISARGLATFLGQHHI
jgi:hypothetical protein